MTCRVKVTIITPKGEMITYEGRLKVFGDRIHIFQHDDGRLMTIAAGSVLTVEESMIQTAAGIIGIA